MNDFCYIIILSFNISTSLESVFLGECVPENRIFLFLLQKLQEFENKYDENIGKNSLCGNQGQMGENDKQAAIK